MIASDELVYIPISSAPIAKIRQFRDGEVTVDYGPAGEVVGIEFAGPVDPGLLELIVEGREPCAPSSLLPLS